MISGIGVDSVKVSRIERLLCDERFQRKVYTKGELEYILSKAHSRQRAQSASGIFCVKEAVLKALSLSIMSVRLIDIETRHEASGKPTVCLLGKLSQHEGKIHVSISHTDEEAIAFVIFER